MKTFTVPVFLGVNAETKQEAIEEALAFMEYALDTGNDEGTFPYCDIGNLNEVVEQEGTIMTLKQFIKEHRAELDACIARALGQDRNPLPNDNERRLWILNDEGLYRWARSEGVRI